MLLNPQVVITLVLVSSNHGRLSVYTQRLSSSPARASCALGHPKQNDFIQSHFRMSQCVACSPARWIFNHVTVCCKGPIATELRIEFQANFYEKQSLFDR